MTDDSSKRAEPATAAGRALVTGEATRQLFHPIDGRRDALVQRILDIEAEAALSRSTPTPDATALTDALAYALARAPVPGKMTTGREYAAQLAPLVIESGYLPTPDATDADGDRPPLPPEVVASDATYMAGLVRGRELEREARDATDAGSVLREAAQSLVDALPYEPGSLLGGKIALVRAALSAAPSTPTTEGLEALVEATDGLPNLIDTILRKYGGTMKGRGDHDIFDALVRYRTALRAARLGERP